MWEDTLCNLRKGLFCTKKYSNKIYGKSEKRGSDAFKKLQREVKSDAVKCEMEEAKNKSHSLL